MIKRLIRLFFGKHMYTRHPSSGQVIRPPCTYLVQTLFSIRRANDPTMTWRRAVVAHRKACTRNPCMLRSSLED